MNWEAIVKNVIAMIVSLGGLSVFVLWIFRFFIKLWADRFLEKMRSEFQVAVEQARSDLEFEVEFKNGKVEVYKEVVNIVSKTLALFDSFEAGRISSDCFESKFDEINEMRLKVYGYLALVAPQAVMDSQDALMDELLKIAGGATQYDWDEIRGLSIDMLNKMRVDIGFDKSPIEYKGSL